WWTKNQPLPIPLVTANPSGGLGSLGGNGTRGIFGNQNLDYHNFSGGRFTVGYLFNQTRGFEGSYFLLENKRSVFNGGADGSLGSAAIGRPFVDSVNGENVIPVASPGVVRGGISVSSESSTFTSGELNLAVNMAAAWPGNPRFTP